MSKISSNHYRKLDNLSQSKKDLVCDNCQYCDRCSSAYTGGFFKKACYNAYLEIKEDLEEELSCEEQQLEYWEEVFKRGRNK